MTHRKYIFHLGDVVSMTDLSLYCDSLF